MYLHFLFRLTVNPTYGNLRRGVMKILKQIPAFGGGGGTAASFY
jgi:hypothetical protein